MRAGSMLAEVSRTTCLISLAIILSFSKFTRPSTVESLPETQHNARDVARLHTEARVNHQLYRQRRAIFWDVFKIRAKLEKLHIATSEHKLVSLMSDWVFGEFLATGSMRKAFFLILNLAVSLLKTLWEEVYLVSLDLTLRDTLK